MVSKRGSSTCIWARSLFNRLRSHASFSCNQTFATFLTPLKVNTYFALWVCFLLLSLPAHSTNGYDFKFKRLNLGSLTLDESHIGAISKITQDRHGFMWFGGEDGVARYDGRSVKIYKAKAGELGAISDNRILDIEIDLNNVMWVATANGLNSYNEATDTFTIYDADTEKKDWFSNNYITQLAIAPDNSLIIGTGSGVSVFNQERDAFSSLPVMPSKEILALLVDRENRLWVGAEGKITSLNLDSNKTISFNLNEHEDGDVEPYSLFEDSQGFLWIGTLGGGINRLDPQREKLERFESGGVGIGSGVDLNSGVVSEFAEFENGNIVAAFDGKGMLLFERTTDSFSFVTHNPMDLNSLSSNQLEYVFVDKQQNLWVGAFTGEINILNRTSNAFKNYSSQLVNTSVLSIEQTKDGYVWVGTEGGLNRLDPNSGSFKSYTHDPKNSNSLAANPVLALQKDEKDNLWVGTWSGGLHYFNRSNDKFTRFLGAVKTDLASKNDFSKKLNDKYVWDLHKDLEGNIWVGTQREGLRYYDEKNQKFVQFTSDIDDSQTLSWNFVRKIIHTRENNLWVGTVSGLNYFDQKNQTFTRYYHDQEDPGSIGSAGAIALLLHSSGDLWVGTEGGGISVRKEGQNRFTRISERDGLPSMTVSTLVEDSEGNVWAGTLNGMVKINSENTKDITVFKTQDGLATNFFNRDASLFSVDGNIYMGGVGGVSIFDPKTLKRYKPNVEIVVTDFKINHVSLPYGESPLSSAPHLVKDIQLKFNQNAFSFKFSVLDFSGSALNEYAYRLVGYDDDWNFVGRENMANYTNLDPGEYVFEVKGVSTDKKWSTETKQIRITIDTPLWKTWWAYMLYLGVFCLVLYFVYVVQYHRIELRKQTELNRNLIELDNIKDSFLASTTHELRTPLNGVIGITEYLISSVSSGRNPKDLLHKLEIISLSGKRLSNLVNDILDSSKLRANKLELIKQEFSLFAVVETVFHIVKYLVAGKDIVLINNVPKEFPLAFGDENRIQQVFFNLVSNAIKFTDHGSISVDVVEKEHFIEVSVEDTGIGVEKKSIKKMFAPYSQLEAAGNRRLGGTGLGVPLTKALIELHDGDLTVSSEVGVGTRFTFTLPKIKKEINSHLSSDNRALDGNGRRVLIVDDDMVNRMILSELLKKLNFTVEEATSGKEVLSKIQEKKVDIVLMDIHMPGQSGWEVCQVLRKELKIEVPVIFLSGNSSQQDLTKSLEVGGQALIGKPISFDKLRLALGQYIFNVKS